VGEVVASYSIVSSERISCEAHVLLPAASLQRKLCCLSAHHQMQQQLIWRAHWGAQVLEDHTRPVLSLAVAGDKLFSGSYDYTIRVWSLDSLQRVKTLTGHTDAVRTLAVAGSKLFSGSYDGTVKVRRACLPK
jgi:WD40 repeat protein